MKQIGSTITDIRRLTKWRIHDRERQLRQMATGPTIAADGCTILIPSTWYKAEAAEFWASQGFTFISVLHRWERDSRQPTKNGKIYSAAAWLKAARRKFYEFWPSLKKECPNCGRIFIPHSHYTTKCPNCTRTKKGQNDD